MTRRLSRLAVALVLPALLGVSAPVVAASTPYAAGIRELVENAPDYGVRNFYKQRGYRPLWLRDGRVGPEVARLLAVLRAVEGGSGRRTAALEQAIDRANSTDPHAAACAELML